MKLSKLAILAVRGACPGIIRKLVDAGLGSDQTIYRYIADNSDNLTKAAALKVIREETGLSDNEILESEETTNEVKA